MVLRGVNWVHNDQLGEIVLKGLNRVHNNKISSNGSWKEWIGYTMIQSGQMVLKGVNCDTQW